MRDCPRAVCRACNMEMRLIEDEAMGQLWGCDGCGVTVKLSDKRPAIEIDRIPREHILPATTLNGGHQS